MKFFCVAFYDIQNNCWFPLISEKNWFKIIQVSLPMLRRSMFSCESRTFCLVTVHTSQPLFDKTDWTHTCASIRLFHSYITSFTFDFGCFAPKEIRAQNTHISWARCRDMCSYRLNVFMCVRQHTDRQTIFLLFIFMTFLFGLFIYEIHSGNICNWWENHHELEIHRLCASVYDNDWICKFIR